MRALAVRALALVEARRLLAHPTVALGTAAGVAFFIGQAPTAEADFLSYKYAVGVFLWPVVIGVFVAANLAASRSRRAGADELFASTCCPSRGSPSWPAPLPSSRP